MRINLNNIGFIIGYYWLIFFCAMVPAGMVAWHHNSPDTSLFLGIMFLGLFVSTLFILTNLNHKNQTLTIQDSFIITLVVWVSTCVIGALPLYFGSVDLGLVDALFQGVSMVTTTGANLILDLEKTDKAILLWCCTMEWLGGKGIIIMALAFMPVTRVGGASLAQSETLGTIEKLTPRFVQTTWKIFIIYLLLTLLCSFMLWIEGLSPFNAVCHALTTISTGGFSTWNNSIQHVDNLVVQITLCFFMYIGGATFLLFLLVSKNGLRCFYRNSEIHAYTAILFFVSGLLIIWRFLTSEENLGTIIMESFFNTTSALSTTGFVTADYSQWGGLAVIIFFFLPIIGGCSGSTAGGIKIYRLQVLLATAISQIQRMRWPHGIFITKYGGKQIDGQTIISVATFFFLYILTFVFLCVLTSMTDLDFLTCISGVVATLTNLGPGLGDVIGPAASYYGLPDITKFIFMLSMLLGRLELIAFYIILFPSFWKR
jgi:trk system potassium uptake protein TrkH